MLLNNEKNGNESLITFEADFIELLEEWKDTINK